MIVFDLKCDDGHVFEAWFGSSASYEDQKARQLVSCPFCLSTDVQKAVMAPAVGAKGNRSSGRGPRAGAPDESSLQPVLPTQTGSNAPSGDVVSAGASKADVAKIKRLMSALAAAQAKALEKSNWVGKDFAKRARAMHYGEEDHRPIHGQSNAEEASELAEEGVNISALPFPVLPPEVKN